VILLVPGTFNMLVFALWASSTIFFYWSAHPLPARPPRAVVNLREKRPTRVSVHSLQGRGRASCACTAGRRHQNVCRSPSARIQAQCSDQCASLACGTMPPRLDFPSLRLHHPVLHQHDTSGQRDTPTRSTPVATGSPVSRGPWQSRHTIDLLAKACIMRTQCPDPSLLRSGHAGTWQLQSYHIASARRHMI
jgi:hypothetical protein